MKHILIAAAIWLSAPWNPISAQNVGGGTPIASDESVERDLSVIASGNRNDEPQLVFADDDALTQAEVLQLLYIATGGATSWRSNKNWEATGDVSDSDLCDNEWHGVTCNDTTKKITELRLSFNNLIGTIPTELGLLSNVEVIDLYFNDLTGTIPTELGLLSNLQRLGLQVNKLTGTIPTQLGLLSSLEQLRLYRNNLDGTIPTQLGLLSSLERLLLYDNNLDGYEFPQEICTLATYCGGQLRRFSDSASCSGDDCSSMTPSTSPSPSTSSAPSSSSVPSSAPSTSPSTSSAPSSSSVPSSAPSIKNAKKSKRGKKAD